MASHSSALVAGLVCLSVAVVVVPMPWLTAGVVAGESSIGLPGCNTSCGEVYIPFPFGMGPAHCWRPGFEISCKDTGNGVLKPFVVSQDDNATAAKVPMEVLSIFVGSALATVLQPIYSSCYDAASGEMVRKPDQGYWNLGSNTPYSFSRWRNYFMVVGCRTLAYISDASGYLTGCLSTRSDGNMSLYPCTGMGCCQTRFSPMSPNYYDVGFDENTTNRTNGTADLLGRCSFAVLMDRRCDFSLSNNSSSNSISSPEDLSALIWCEGAGGGKAPVVLDWHIRDDDEHCLTAPTKPGYACVSTNSKCMPWSGGYYCICKAGFDGNPYLPDGCKAVWEGCKKSCGAVEIPFPFGMGNCSLPGFEISCKDTGNGVHKPFVVSQKNATPLEILSISIERAEARVLQTIYSYCYDAASQKMVREPDQVWRWDLGDNTPYSLSSTANMFKVVGCRALAYIGDNSTKTNMCLAMCLNGNMNLSLCSGMGCCQTAVPKGLKNYEVWFDERLNGSAGLIGGPCSFAVLMDSSNFTLSTTSSDIITWPVGDITLSAFHSFRGGKAPVVLDWSVGDDNCSSATTIACVSTNSSCSDASSGRGYICKCDKGFDGNPYLPDGCKDIDECALHYPCYGVCTNTIGSFSCDCPPGTQGNASNAECQTARDPFPLGARVATGISAGLLVALIAFLSTQVFLNKQNKKRQAYFEQHGGRMLSRILVTDGNIAFKIYDRADLEKATHGFHKANIVGEGAHGTVYKATIGTATVAVKRCKQIDKTRTDEFVQELVVLCRVSHPNIVRLLGCCLHFEAPMLVYEFVPNGTLSDLLYGRPRRRVTLPTRLRIATETAEALAHLHSPPHPTLHGDVKPQNILLGKGYVAKVSDFGCSTINDNVQVVPKGTLAYLDPEFLQDFQITDKTDVYSFGIVLIELLTGKNPQAKKWKNLTVMFQNSLGNGTLGDLLDADIVEEGGMGLIYAVAKLVSRCIAVPGNGRPAMGQVAVELHQFSDEMPESPEARAALEVEEGSRYRYTATVGETTTTTVSNLAALSTELAR